MSAGKHVGYSSRLHSKIGRFMYLSDETSDFAFIFETATEIIVVPAHKYVLVAANNVFRERFNGPWKEKDNVKMPVGTSDAFKEFLRFFYFDRVNVTVKHVAELLDLAQEFGVIECSNICNKFLNDNIR